MENIYVDFVTLILSGVIIYMSLQNKPHSYINLVYLTFILLLYVIALRTVLINATNGKTSSPTDRAKLTFWLGGFLALSEIIHATLSFNQSNYLGGLIQSSLALIFGATAINQFDAISVGGMPLLTPVEVPRAAQSTPSLQPKK